MLEGSHSSLNRNLLTHNLGVLPHPVTEGFEALLEDIGGGEHPNA